jgi:RNA polymerase-binding transcription factor DksA
MLQKRKKQYVVTPFDIVKAESTLGLRDRTNGVCLLCSKPIPARQRQAIPGSVYCRPCQEKLDSLSRWAA